MERIEVEITAQMLSAIRAQIDAGIYLDASDAVRDALRRSEVIQHKPLLEDTASVSFEEIAFDPEVFVNEMRQSITQAQRAETRSFNLEESIKEWDAEDSKEHGDHAG